MCYTIQAMLRLDMQRNKVLMASIVISIISTNITFGSYISGIFGMNLDNISFIQLLPGMFPTIWVGTMVVMVVASWAMYYWFVIIGVLPFHDTHLEEKYLNI